MKLQENKIKNLFAHDYFENLGGGENLALTFLKNNKSFSLLTFFISNFLKKKLKYKKIILLSNYNNKIILLFKIFFYKVNGNIKNYIASGNYTPLLKVTNYKKKIFYCHSLPKFFFLYEKFYSKKNIFLYITHCNKNKTNES